MTLLTQALCLAATAFDGMVDRSGNPTILHTMRVSARGKTEDECIVGALHDLVEDTAVTLNDLRAIFPEHIVATVDRLSRRSDETYKAFIRRIAEDAFAIQCKLNDIADNLQRVGQLPSKEGTGLRRRYVEARITLVDPTMTEDDFLWLETQRPKDDVTKLRRHYLETRTRTDDASITAKDRRWLETQRSEHSAGPLV